MAVMREIIAVMRGIIAVTRGIIAVATGIIAEMRGIIAPMTGILVAVRATFLGSWDTVDRMRENGQHGSGEGAKDSERGNDGMDGVKDCREERNPRR